MQFSDTTTRQGLIQDCEDLTGLGPTGISGNTQLLQQFTRWVNQWNHKVTTMILESSDDWDHDDTNRSDYPVATTSLVAGQRDYTFPSSLQILKIKRVDVAYDGLTLVWAEPIDSKQLVTVGDTVDSQFSKARPGFDAKANSIWLYPLPDAADISNGGFIRIEFFREAVEFATTDTIKEPGFDEPFHRILSVGASLDYAMTYQKPIKNDLAVMLADHEKRLHAYYSSKNIKRARLTPVYRNYE